MRKSLQQRTHKEQKKFKGTVVIRHCHLLIVYHLKKRHSPFKISYQSCLVWLLRLPIRTVERTDKDEIQQATVSLEYRK